jgi:uncharacterized protein (UPF0371 family)
LVADLLTADQKYRGLQGVDLTERIENRDGKFYCEYTPMIWFDRVTNIVVLVLNDDEI